MIIETERLCLRPIIKSDADDIYEYSKGANVGPNVGWKPHENIEETLKIMDLLFIDKENIWGITGNSFFLKNIIIIDYKNKKFGVK